MNEKKMNLTFDDYIFINDFFDEIVKSTKVSQDTTKNPEYICYFKPKEACSPGLPNKYELPFIGISEEEPKNENLFDGCLGKYFHGRGEDILREGKIVLYRKNIEKIAVELSLEERIDFNLANSLIFKIVLAHELSHWMFHYCPTSLDENEQDSINRLYHKINSNFHEYIAQKLTRKIFDIHPLFKVVFNWLLSRQNEPYLFEMPEEIFHIVAFKYNISLNVKNNVIIQEALLLGELNYECFKKLINKTNGFRGLRVGRGTLGL